MRMGTGFGWMCDGPLLGRALAEADTAVVSARDPARAPGKSTHGLCDWQRRRPGLGGSRRYTCARDRQACLLVRAAEKVALGW